MSSEVDDPQNSSGDKSEVDEEEDSASTGLKRKAESGSPGSESPDPKRSKSENAVIIERENSSTGPVFAEFLISSQSDLAESPKESSVKNEEGGHEASTTTLEISEDGLSERDTADSEVANSQDKEGWTASILGEKQEKEQSPEKSKSSDSSSYEGSDSDKELLILKKGKKKRKPKKTDKAQKKLVATASHDDPEELLKKEKLKKKMRRLLEKSEPSGKKKTKSKKKVDPLANLEDMKLSDIIKLRKIEENPRILKLKRFITLCGMRCNYKQMFADMSTEKERIAKLEEFLESKGLEVGSLTLEKCKMFKAKRDQEKELQDLDVANIIVKEGRSLRSREVPVEKKKKKRVHLESESPIKNAQADEVDDTTTNEAEAEKTKESKRLSEGSDSGAEEVRKECKEMMSRLKGIVDSEGDQSS